tara:strand:- start:37 stop:237 length:201 start_codon:yes stop_codon:yes gene_type:complete
LARFLHHYYLCSRFFGTQQLESEKVKKLEKSKRGNKSTAFASLERTYLEGEMDETHSSDYQAFPVR